MKLASQDNIDTLRRVFFNKTAYIVYVVVAACALFYVVQMSRVEARLESEINQIAEVAGLTEVVRPFETTGPAICSSSCLSGSKTYRADSAEGSLDKVRANYSVNLLGSEERQIYEIKSNSLSYDYRFNIDENNKVGIGAITHHGIFDL